MPLMASLIQSCVIRRQIPKYLSIKNCPVGMIATKIEGELKKLVGSQKIKEVLIIGEARSCKALLKTTAQQLKQLWLQECLS